MKKLAILAICCLLFVDCKKTDDLSVMPLETNKTSLSDKTTFIVAGLSPERSVGAVKKDSNAVNHLYFLRFGLCKEEGYDCYLHGPSYGGVGLVSHQTPADANFGVFTTSSLGAGDFIYIVGANRSIEFDDEYISTWYGSWRRPFAYISGNCDFLFYNTRISANVSGEQEVTLSRLSSQLQFVINDPMPVNTKEIEISFPSSARFSFNDLYNPDYHFYEPVFTNFISKKITTAEWGKSGFSIATFLSNTANEGGAVEFDMTVKVTFCFPAKPMEKSVHVTCYNNRRTIVQGKLFNVSNRVQFTQTTNSKFILTDNQGI